MRWEKSHQIGLPADPAPGGVSYVRVKFCSKIQNFAVTRIIVVLEPDAVKVASPVLRGGWSSNGLSLPAVRHESLSSWRHKASLKALLGGPNVDLQGGLFQG
jgi:hypothetical protein